MDNIVTRLLERSEPKQKESTMRKMVTIFSLVVFVALIGITQATTIDPTTSKAYDFNINKANDVNINKASDNNQNDASIYDSTIRDYINPNPVTLDTRGGNILWDLTHGVTYGYDPYGLYSNLTAYLDGLDFTMDTTSIGLNNIDLSQYDIIVISLGSSWHGAYTPSEIAAVEAFVNNGGGLFIMGDNSACPIGNINPMAQSFGMNFGGYLYPLDLYVSDFENHPIFNGITEIYYRAAGDIAITGPAEWVAYSDAGQGVAAAAEVGAGRVVALSDLNCFENSYYGISQNQAFSGNIFNWLAHSDDADILWDLTHGVYLSYEPSGYYSDLAALLAGEGHGIAATASGLDNVDLSGYSAIVICLGSAWDEAYTPSEVAAIQAFVADGGGLLVMGDNIGCPNDNINPVSQEFGTTCGISSISPEDLYITNLEDHAIFNGISEIFFRIGGEISVIAPSSVVASYESYAVVSAAEVGSGRVVVLGDLNCFDNTQLSYSQNQAFAINIFDWFIQTPSDNIIWDITHGVYMDSYSPDFSYAIMQSLIEPHGHSIITTDAGVENIDLSMYDVLVVSWGTAYSSAYSSSEVDAIEAFVENGGGLLVMGDNPGCPNGNINPVSQAFGVTCGDTTIGPNISDLEEHEVFEGVSEIYFVGGGAINVTSPSMPIASNGGGLHAVSAYSDGNAKVIVMGDANLFQDAYIIEADNEDFSVNLFNWLAEDETGIEDIKSIIPMAYSLSQNYPNPFNARTIIQYNLPEASQVSIDIFDLLGRKVASLVDEKQTSGIHQVIWNADNVSSGMYFYKLQAGDNIETKSMTLLK